MEESATCLLLSTCSQTFKCVIFFRLQLIPPRGPFRVSRKVTMRDEPDIELRCSIFTCFLCKKTQSVLSVETLFHRIGPLFHQIGRGLFSKSQRSYSNETPCMKHPASALSSSMLVAGSQSVIWRLSPKPTFLSWHCRASFRCGPLLVKMLRLVVMLGLGLGVFSLHGAPLALPTFAIPSFSEFCPWAVEGCTCLGQWRESSPLCYQWVSRGE